MVRVKSCYIPQVLFLAALLVAAAASVVYSNTYCVSPTGSDSDTGEMSHPWKTISFGITQISPGDSLLIHGGTYSEDEIWVNYNFKITGEPGRYLTIAAFPGEKPTITGSRMLVTTRYVKIEGLHFEGMIIAVGLITDVGPSDHIILYGNQFTGQESPPIYFMCDHGIVENNLFDLGASSTSHGLYVMHGDSSVVRGNTLKGMYRYGIHIYDENKYQYAGVFAPKITNLIVEKNIVIGSQTAAGIIVSPGESPNLQIEINNTVIRNNVIYKNKLAGVAILYHGKIRNLAIYNNTICENGGGVYEDAVDADSVFIQNNIFYKNGSTNLNIGDMSNLLVSHNLYWRPNATGDNIADSNPVFQDPLFEDASQGNFRLQANSPAIDAGMDIGLPYVGSAPDLGAFEYDTALPVDLISFQALASDTAVRLLWATASESHNHGFEVERSLNRNSEYKKIGFVRGHGTTTSSFFYEFLDHQLADGRYYYRLRQLNLDGSFRIHGPLEVHVKKKLKFTLLQNTPNPFTRWTDFSFDLPQDSFVEVNVYNIKGQRVRQIFTGFWVSGRKTLRWYGLDGKGNKVPTGLYFYEVRTPQSRSIRKMILMQ